MTETIRNTGVTARITQMIKRILNLKALTKLKCSSSRINPSMLKTWEIMRKTTRSSATSRARVLQLQDSRNLYQGHSSTRASDVFSKSLAEKTILLTSPAMVKSSVWAQVNRVCQAMEAPALVIHPKYWSPCVTSEWLWLPVVTVTQWYWPIKVSYTHGVAATKAN